MDGESIRDSRAARKVASAAVMAMADGRRVAGGTDVTLGMDATAIAASTTGIRIDVRGI